MSVLHTDTVNQQKQCTDQSGNSSLRVLKFHLDVCIQNWSDSFLDFSYKFRQRERTGPKKLTSFSKLLLENPREFEAILLFTTTYGSRRRISLNDSAESFSPKTRSLILLRSNKQHQLCQLHGKQLHDK